MIQRGEKRLCTLHIVNVVSVTSSCEPNRNRWYSPLQALGHFRQWRRLAYCTARGPSAAAAELCIGHTHLRLAVSLIGASDNQDEGAPVGPGGNAQNDVHNALEEGLSGAQNDHRNRPQPKPRHWQLCEAQRHYHRCVRHVLMATRGGRWRPFTYINDGAIKE